MQLALVWFRDDLRLDDNPALRAAVERDYLPLPVYVHAPQEEGEWAPGAASDAWRRHALTRLDAALRARGSQLLVLQGDSLRCLQQLADRVGAEAVFWNRRYEPAIEQRDTTIKRTLRQSGLHAESFNGALLFEPWELATKQGDPYKVFTPYWKTARASWRTPRLWDAPDHLPSPAALDLPEDTTIDAILPAPSPAWDSGFWQRFTPGEEGARAALSRFVGDVLTGYDASRDVPSVRGTSRLSPHLHFGELSPGRAAAAVLEAGDAIPDADRDRFLAELGWREFAHHVLHHFPRVPTQNLNPRFDDFPWASVDPAALQAWQQGRTGVPIIDAGMRELWHTGWMHNRIRMVVASWLTKHMRLHWEHGARWFWDTLVDANLANNTQGWQWTAGTGADAAPYFRVFNPVSQAQKFDAAGDYIARWVPELAKLPAKARMAPWEHADLLRRLAPDYPRRPMVDLAEGRKGALDAFAALKVDAAR